MSRGARNRHGYATWCEWEDALLRRHWHGATRADRITACHAVLPARTRGAIQQRAHVIGLSGAPTRGQPLPISPYTRLTAAEAEAIDTATLRVRPFVPYHAAAQAPRRAGSEDFRAIPSLRCPSAYRLDPPSRGRG